MRARFTTAIKCLYAQVSAIGVCLSERIVTVTHTPLGASLGRIPCLDAEVPKGAAGSRSLVQLPSAAPSWQAQQPLLSQTLAADRERSLPLALRPDLLCNAHLGFRLRNLLTLCRSRAMRSRQQACPPQ